MEFILVLNIFDSVVQFIESFFESPVDFFFEHYQNPVLWLAFFGAGLGIFHATYRTLNKDQ